MKDLLLPVDQDLPLVRLVHAVELAHEGALARTVLAEQGVHLAGRHVEIDMIVGKHAGKALDDAAHFDALDALLLRAGRPGRRPRRRSGRRPGRWRKQGFLRHRLTSVSYTHLRAHETVLDL